ncbi:hypothetical protein AB5J72_07480 [Streptomyces sp. CG1]|uniref:hypothetical protein n=1 Tax=Streptomyces sp. CG1 TaxID=1287523 RepID=UPI0034E21ADD
MIKASWMVGAIAGVLPISDGFGLPGWVVLNRAIIAEALALVRPWGLRLPVRLVASVAWVSTGFLVPCCRTTYAVLDSLLGRSDGAPRHPRDGGPATPDWDATLIHASFVGMGLGLAIALPRAPTTALAGGVRRPGRRRGPWPRPPARCGGLRPPMR